MSSDLPVSLKRGVQLVHPPSPCLDFSQSLNLTGGIEKLKVVKEEWIHKKLGSGIGEKATVELT